MKVTIIKKKGKNETITRHPVEDIALFYRAVYPEGMAAAYRYRTERDV